MREIALYDAKNKLSALVAEVEASGEEIVITRHGAPAAKLTPVAKAASVEERAGLLARIAADRDAWARAHPEAAQPIPWEDVKTWLEDER
ncbi:MAG: type II toxin-antitoxin system Phd/YefM family antitoxin [Hyphomonadaceae bacterium]|nr:type II toxin-antitoxin system Phd/YefM family antitoxin [Hyphomonadaceae bacterium]